MEDTWEPPEDEWGDTRDGAWPQEAGWDEVLSERPGGWHPLPTPAGPVTRSGRPTVVEASHGDDTAWPMLAAVLVEKAAEAVSTAGGRVTVIDRLARLSRRYDGLLAAQIGALFDDLMMELGGDVEAARDGVAAELRAALRLTRRSAERLVDEALAADRFPRLVEAWTEGRLDRRRVRIVTEALASLDDEIAGRICDEVLERAAGLTTGQLTAWLRRLVVAADPQAAERREQEGRRGRRVEVSSAWDGTARLFASGLPAAVAMAAFDRIDRLARRHQDARSIDQRRADILCDLLLGTADSTEVSVSLHVQADLSTLAGLSEAPGELSGFGPISADLVRRLASTAGVAEGGFTYRIDSDEGIPLAAGRLRRRPTADQRRTVVIRDRTCIFPGCRTPAYRCDLDHRVPWSEGGTTHAGQLVALCRHDHGLRHRLGWEHRPSEDHDHLWTSPTGHTYPTRPTRDVPATVGAGIWPTRTSSDPSSGTPTTEATDGVPDGVDPPSRHAMAYATIGMREVGDLRPADPGIPGDGLPDETIADGLAADRNIAQGITAGGNAAQGNPAGRNAGRGLAASRLTASGLAAGDGSAGRDVGDGMRGPRPRDPRPRGRRLPGVALARTEGADPDGDPNPGPTRVRSLAIEGRRWTGPRSDPMGEHRRRDGPAP